jgi:hypothetical protein
MPGTAQAFNAALRGSVLERQVMKLFRPLVSEKIGVSGMDAASPIGINWIQAPPVVSNKRLMLAAMASTSENH